MQRRFFPVALILAGLCFGCSGAPSGPAKFRLSGKVLYQGQPVPQGEVRLTPNEESGNKGPASIAIIHDGHFETRDGYGIVGGLYKVVIRGYESAQLDNENSDAPPQIEKELFPAYEETVYFAGVEAVHDFEIPDASE